MDERLPATRPTTLAVAESVSEEVVKEFRKQVN